VKISIIATGVSLKDFDLSSIEGYKISVNYAYKYVDCDIIVCYDDPKLGHMLFPEEMTHTLKEHNYGTGYEVGSAHGFDRRPGYVTMFNSSLFMAMNIAINMGATEIDVYGADMELTDGYAHFYDDEPATEKLVAHYNRRFKKNMKEWGILKKQLRSYEKINFIGYPDR
jgi:adenylosuccinate synthase